MSFEDMEYWDQERFNRLRRDDRDPSPIAYYESSTGNIAWIPGEFLIGHTEADALDLDGARGDRDDLVRADHDGLPATLRLYRRSVQGASTRFLSYVQSLRNELRGPPHRVPEPVIGVHYVMTGEAKGTVPRGGPASNPWVTGLVSPAPSWGAGVPLVAVVDTGVDVAAPWSDQISFLDEDRDPLYAPGAPAGTLGSQAGHGTFIASLIQRMAGGGIPMRAVRVLDVDGTASELDVVLGLSKLRQRPESDQLLVVNLSLGGFTDDGSWTAEEEHPPAFLPTDPNKMPVGLAAELALWASEKQWTAFVACAGNDGQHRPFWPAALADHRLEPTLSRPFFIAVGSLARTLEASNFTNTGDWVTVSTLGEDLVSDYPRGLFPVTSSYSDEFTRPAARWSGTSFAAPVVAAELVRIIRDDPAAVGYAKDALQVLTERVSRSEPGLLGLIWDPRNGESGPVRDPRLP